MFTAIKTSVLNVESVIETVEHWQNTDEVIQERNRLNVLFVANDLHKLVTLLHTVEFTVERNHTNVMCAIKCLKTMELCTNTC